MSCVYKVKYSRECNRAEQIGRASREGRTESNVVVNDGRQELPRTKFVRVCVLFQVICGNYFRLFILLSQIWWNWSELTLPGSQKEEEQLKRATLSSHVLLVASVLMYTPTTPTCEWLFLYRKVLEVEHERRSKHIHTHEHTSTHTRTMTRIH